MNRECEILGSPAGANAGYAQEGLDFPVPVSCGLQYFWPHTSLSSSLRSCSSFSPTVSAYSHCTCHTSTFLIKPIFCPSPSCLWCLVSILPILLLLSVRSSWDLRALRYMHSVAKAMKAQEGQPTTIFSILKSRSLKASLGLCDSLLCMGEYLRPISDKIWVIYLLHTKMFLLVLYKLRQVYHQIRLDSHKREL